MNGTSGTRGTSGVNGNNGSSGTSGVNGNNGSSGSNGAYAYATDIYAESTTGKVEGVCNLGDGRIAFCVNGDGLFIEHATELVE